MTTCKNCRTELDGKYCHLCGEKVVEANDFSVKTLLGQFTNGLFNIDSKIFRTFKYILFKPGQLTRNYVEGIRQPFMKPIQLFLVCNVLFFLLLTQADILRIPAKYYFNDSRTEILNKTIKETGISELQLRQDYNNISMDLSKGAVILLLPLLTLVLILLHLSSKHFFGMHLIFSMHSVSFFFLSCLLAVSVVKFGNRLLQIFIVLINLVYFILANREFYNNSWLMSIIKSFIFIIAFFGLVLAYREFISYLSFKLL